MPAIKPTPEFDPQYYRFLASRARFCAAEIEFRGMLREFLPIGCRVHVRTGFEFIGTVKAYEEPANITVCITPDNPNLVPEVWKNNSLWERYQYLQIPFEQIVAIAR